MSDMTQDVGGYCWSPDKHLIALLSNEMTIGYKWL